MINNKKILAIIPARGGSKGVLRKNIKLLNGKPLIAYTIEEAKRSKYIDKIIVSTEDEEIAEISKGYGAEVPFLRPENIAKDDTPGIEPILHAVNWFKDKGEHFSYVMCLQCTSPFRTVRNIDEAIEKFKIDNTDSVVSVCESEISPYWMRVIEEDKLKDFIRSGEYYSRRQDLPKIYRLNGAIYIAKIETLFKVNNWYTDNTLPYVMDKINSVDIDDILDFKYSEFLMKEYF